MLLWSRCFLGLALAALCAGNDGSNTWSPYLHKKLSTSCHNNCQRCFQLQPDPCENKCIDGFGDKQRWEIWIRHGTYKSSREKENEVDASWRARREEVEADGQLPILPTDDAVNGIESLAIPSYIKRLWIIGGSHKQLKGFVVNVTLAPDLIASSNVSYVALKALNLYESKPQLSAMLPLKIKDLEVGNALLETIPDDIIKFQRLTRLALRDNYLSDFPAKFNWPDLTTLELDNNDLTSFSAAFPKMQRLNLSYNNLTSIPQTIFKMPNLTRLGLSANQLHNIRLTADQYAFLSRPGLQVEIDDITNTDCSSSSIKQIKTASGSMANFCVEDDTTSANPTETVASHASEPSANVIVGSVAGTLVITGAVVGYWGRWKKRLNPVLKENTIRTSTTSSFVPCEDEAVWFADDKKIMAMRMNATELHDIKCIGSGAFGEVWRVAYQGRRLAAKRLLSRTSSIHVDKFVNEIKLNASLSHSRIVRFEGVAWTCKTDLQALFEYMPRGDLRKWLDNPARSKAWTTQKLLVAMDIVEALVYVHSFNPPLMHRDLKSRNILLSDDMRAKLCDFGTARFHSYEDTMTMGIGTALWLAPEVIACRNTYDQFADIYSFGVVLSELDTHAMPYADAVEDDDQPMHLLAIVHQVALGALKPTFLPSCPTSIQNLAASCLAANPKERPSAISLAHSLSKIWHEFGFPDQRMG